MIYELVSTHFDGEYRVLGIRPGDCFGGVSNVFDSKNEHAIPGGAVACERSDFPTGTPSSVRAMVERARSGLRRAMPEAQDRFIDASTLQVEEHAADGKKGFKFVVDVAVEAPGAPTVVGSFQGWLTADGVVVEVGAAAQSNPVGDINWVPRIVARELAALHERLGDSDWEAERSEAWLRESRGQVDEPVAFCELAYMRPRPPGSPQRDTSGQRPPIMSVEPGTRVLSIVCGAMLGGGWAGTDRNKSQAAQHPLLFAMATLGTR